MLLENIKKRVEIATRIARPSYRQAQALIRDRKGNARRFADDGLTPNSPKWPLIHYRGVAKLDSRFDAAAIFEVLFGSHGWRGGIYDFPYHHSRTHEVLGIARGTARERFGGARGRTIELKTGDVIVQPAGTGHQRLAAFRDLLVAGAYPAGSDYDECRSKKAEHDRALGFIARTRRARADPVYGTDGPLRMLWR